jgi:hypothetical protein
MAVQCLDNSEPDLIWWLRHLECEWSVKRGPTPGSSVPTWAGALLNASDEPGTTYRTHIAGSCYTLTWTIALHLSLLEQSEAR